MNAHQSIIVAEKSGVDIHKAVLMWMAQATMIDMAIRFGVSPMVIRGIVRRHRNLFPIREKATSQRAKVDIKIAAEMWAKEISARVIGRHFGVNHGVIHGIANTHRSLFPKRDDLSWHKPSTPKQRVERVRREVQAFAADPKMFNKTTEYDLGRQPFAKILTDRANTECHWPINDGGPFLYCSAEITGSSRYCTHHHDRAHPMSTNTHTAIARRRAQ